MLTRRTVRWVDERFGAAKFTRTALAKVFPDHWSFMLGEIGLYCFLILVLTGLYLTFFFDPSQTETVYDGSFEPLRGVPMTEAYRSALELSFDVRAGMLMRQIHHWAALLFVAGTAVHLMRVFFTGAFRKPRELNWIIGVVLLVLIIANGFAGYSLVDDQLSGTGLRIAYSIALSIPLAGTWIASLFFGGEFPGPDVIARLYVLHILVLPAIIAIAILAHLGLIIRQKHTHFGSRRAREDNVVGERFWPFYAFKALGLFLLTTAVLCVLGGVAQINPIWLYGPFDPAEVSSASQPDWYMGWLDGALRLLPNVEVRAFGFELPNPFFPGVLLPTVTFTLLAMWPFLEARRTGDRDHHHVLDRPRDRPVRTALGVATIAFYGVLFFAGASDVLSVAFGLSVNAVFWAFRVLLFVLPPVAAWVTYRLCKELSERDRRAAHPVAPRRGTSPDAAAAAVAARSGDGSPGRSPAPKRPAPAGRER